MLELCPKPGFPNDVGVAEPPPRPDCPNAGAKDGGLPNAGVPPNVGVDAKEVDPKPDPDPPNVFEVPPKANGEAEDAFEVASATFTGGCELEEATAAAEDRESSCVTTSLGSAIVG